MRSFAIRLLCLSTIVIDAARNSTRNCREGYVRQPVDHFSSSPVTYDERYYVCSGEYSLGGPLFFYTGNESPVEMYVNNTGLMWETARDFGALLVFAEHRYYGKSQPFPECSNDNLQWLQAGQAMADYAAMIEYLRPLWGFSAVITFGGSYGGMLSAWMRIRYPHIVQGAIAASAPVFSLVGLVPAPDEYVFNRIIAADAGEACGDMIRHGLELIAELSKTSQGRDQLHSGLGTCKSLKTEEDALGLIDYVSEVWGVYAMGDYPYASDYMTDAEGPGEAAMLPAFPMKAACAALSQPKGSENLLAGLRNAVSLWYNVTGDVDCLYNSGKRLGVRTHLDNRKMHDVDSGQCGTWDYQFCAEFMMPFSQGSPDDFLFPAKRFDLGEARLKCTRTYNTASDIHEPVVMYGGYESVKQGSNIVFSNGDLDPWTGFGVDCRVHECGHDVTSPLVTGGAHHLDLMFGNENDPESVAIVRTEELKAIRRWIATYIPQVYESVQVVIA